MRAYYWSNTRFADWLRGLFGIEAEPKAATHQGWAEYKKTARDTSKFGYALVEYLNRIQNMLMYIPDKLDSIRYYFSNIKNQSHVLRTQTKRGSWGDLVTKIPDALMLSVIDFIEQECFWMAIAWSDADPTDPNAELITAFKNQSYTRRKFFPIEVSDSIRASYGFQWLDYQINSRETTKRGIERHPYQKIKAAYKFAKCRYLTFDAYEESMLATLYTDMDDIFSPMTPERRNAYDTMTELETQFKKELLEHCTNVVKYHEYLWT